MRTVVPGQNPDKQKLYIIRLRISWRIHLSTFTGDPDYVVASRDENVKIALSKYERN